MSTEPEKRLPDPSAEQVREGHQIIRRALDGEEIRIWSDSEGRLCWAPIETGDVRQV